MAKLRKCDEIALLIEEIKGQGYEEKVFKNGTFFIAEKNDYSFRVYFVYNDTEFTQPTFDEISYDLKNRNYYIRRNNKDLSFSDENLKRSFGRITSSELSFLEVPGNEGFYQTCFDKISKIEYERTKMVSRFLVRLIEDYPVLERVHKAGFPITKCFGDIRDFKTNSLLEAFRFESKFQLKVYKECLAGDFGVITNSWGGITPISLSATYIRNLKPEELQFIKELQTWTKELDSKYGLSKGGEILQQCTSSYGSFKDTSLGEFFISLDYGDGKKPNKKRLIEYLGYETDVRQGLTSFRSTMNLYRDYIRMSKELGTKFDRYPKCLSMRHDIAAKYYRIIREVTNIGPQFEESCNKVKHLEGNIGKTGWAIVVPTAPEDLIDEGEQLSHCVKSYIQTVATGDVQIVFLRKADSLEVSEYTVEIRENAIVQFAGYCNCAPSDDAKEAIHALAESFNLIENYE